ncbi:hypothetical protein [Pseudoalteromonas rhizosphaerae]|uniref:hypothetical protein n=1 Tax=Pseudoalteromonas rhizosphaerae TaxID=2518973 RepID=UPI00384BF581
MSQPTKHGEYILLYWDDKTHEYIRGHVTQAEAQKVLDFECEDLKVTSIRHTYAFWGVGNDECGEPCSVFYPREEPGRGRFKVTEIGFTRKDYANKI